jgi:WD40 repeat protein
MLWDVAGGNALASFKRVVGAYRMAFSPDLRTLASPNYQEIDLWDVASGKERLVLSEHRGAVRCVAFSPDGKTLVAASAVNEGDSRYRGEVKVWDVAGGKEMAALKGQFGEVVNLALSPDGKALALLDRPSLDADVELRLLELTTGRTGLSHRFTPRSFLIPLFASDGRLFVAEATAGNAVKLWEDSRTSP